MAAGSLVNLELDQYRHQTSSRYVALTRLRRPGPPPWAPEAVPQDSEAWGPQPPLLARPFLLGPAVGQGTERFLRVATLQEVLAAWTSPSDSLCFNEAEYFQDAALTTVQAGDVLVVHEAPVEWGDARETWDAGATAARDFAFPVVGWDGTLGRARLGRPAWSVPPGATLAWTLTRAGVPVASGTAGALQREKPGLSQWLCSRFVYAQTQALPVRYHLSLVQGQLRALAEETARDREAYASSSPRIRTAYTY